MSIKRKLRKVVKGEEVGDCSRFLALIATLWFLVRVIPKPSRITYPCQRASLSMLFMKTGIVFSTFVTSTTSFIQRKSVKTFSVLVLVGVVLVEPATMMYYRYKYDSMNIAPLTLQDMFFEFPSNRVARVHSDEATSWDFNTGYYWENVDQSVIDRMVEEGVKALTDSTDAQSAWQEIMTNYTLGDEVGIKINGNDWWNNDDREIDSLPQLTNSIIKGLKSIGVPEVDIHIVENTYPSRGLRRMRDYYTTIITAEYPNVIFIYANQTSPTYGNVAGTDVNFPYTSTRRINDQIAGVDHLILVPIMKAITPIWGTTGSIKLMQGVIEDVDAFHQWLDRITADNPNVLMYQNQHIIGKTRLIIGDGFFGTWTGIHFTGGYGGVDDLNSPINDIPKPWVTFDNRAPNCLFFGVDPVAIDSVMYDHILAERNAQDQVQGQSMAPFEEPQLIAGAAAGLGIREHAPYSDIDYIEVELGAPVSPNNPPVAEGLMITPSSPYTSDDLVGSYTYSDADGDPENGTEIRWYKDGVLQSDYHDTLTVLSSSTTPGEVWYFTVRPRDGEDFGLLQTSPSVRIRAPMAYIFSDGFEDGVPGNWYWVTQFRGTIIQSSEQAHHGSYSAKVDVTATNGHALVSETLSSPLSTAHIRCYVYFTAFPADTYQTCFLRSSGDTGVAPSSSLVSATVYNDGGTVKWAMVYENAGDYRVIANSPLPQLSTWFCVEIKTLVHGTSGEARMYIDNMEILTQTGLDNDAYGNVEYCVAGSTSLPLGTNGIATCHIDCVAVDDTFIGTEEEQPPPDTTPPTYSNVGTNTTWAGQPCLFYAKWSDDTSLSGYIFGTNNAGTWTNDTWMPLSGFSDWSNVTKTLNLTVGVLVQYRFYCNDTSNNWNLTPIQSLTVTEPPPLYASDLSLLASSSSALVGYKVKIVGRLVYQHNSSGISNVLIQLYYSVTGGENWIVITSTTTTSEGSYYVTWFPMCTGNYLIKAVYTGEEKPNVVGAETMINLIITDIEEQVFSVSSNSIVSSLTFNSTTREITFNVEGPEGTMGYTDIFLSKYLVPDINDLRIYLDGVEESYEAVSVDDVWFTRLTYHHSIHTVRIVLSSASPTYIFTEPVTKLIVGALIASVASFTLLALFRKKKVKK